MCVLQAVTSTLVQKGALSSGGCFQIPYVSVDIQQNCLTGFCLVSWQKPGMDVADGYVTFVRHSQDMLREKINEEVYTERLFDVSLFQRFDFYLQNGGVQIKL